MRYFIHLFFVFVVYGFRMNERTLVVVWYSSGRRRCHYVSHLCAVLCVYLYKIFVFLFDFPLVRSQLLFIQLCGSFTDGLTGPLYVVVVSIVRTHRRRRGNLPNELLTHIIIIK